MDELVLDKPRQANQNPPAVTKLKQQKFLEQLSQTGEFRKACQAVEIDYTTPYQWAYKGEHFAKRLEEARTRGEKVLLDRVEEQIDSRVFAGKDDPQSAVLTMFRTKRLDPRYRDNAPTQVNLTGPVSIQLNIGASVQAIQALGKAES